MLTKTNKYETRTSGDTIENVCLYCQNSEKLNFSGIMKKLNSYDGAYARVTSAEMVAL